MNELEQALRVIKEECEKHNKCLTCPLRTYDSECYIRQKCPYEWKLASDEKTVIIPRVFV